MVASFVHSLLWCNKCLRYLPASDFYNSHILKRGKQYHCKACSAVRTTTLSFALQRLLSTCKSNAKRRARKGRDSAGVCTLTLEQLFAIYDRQRGLCYWFPTKKMSLVPHSSWRMSLDRLNPDKGYTMDNCVMSCLEFNGPRTWSWQKIGRMMSLRYSAFNLAAFDEALIPTHGCQHGADRQDYDNGSCRLCVQEHAREIRAGTRSPSRKHEPCTHGPNRPNKKDGNCKLCGLERTARSVKQPRGFLRAMLADMTRASKKRDQTAAMEFAFDDLVRLARMQVGKCTLTAVPQAFAAGEEFAASPMRIDVKRGFTLDNVTFVAAEFNTTRNLRRAAVFKDNDDDSGWTPAKIQEWLSWLDSSEGRAHIEVMCAKEAAAKEDKEEQKEEV